MHNGKYHCLCHLCTKTALNFLYQSISYKPFIHSLFLASFYCACRLSLWSINFVLRSCSFISRQSRNLSVRSVLQIAPSPWHFSVLVFNVVFIMDFLSLFKNYSYIISSQTCMTRTWTRIVMPTCPILSRCTITTKSSCIITRSFLNTFTTRSTAWWPVCPIWNYYKR